MKRRDRRQPPKNTRSSLRKYMLLTIGAVIQGFAMGVFLFPNYIPSGGAGGFTVLLNYWFGIPLSLALWIMNASMLLFALHYLGGRSTIGTLYGITVASISVNLFERVFGIPIANCFARHRIRIYFFRHWHCYSSKTRRIKRWRRRHCVDHCQVQEHQSGEVPILDQWCHLCDNGLCHCMGNHHSSIDLPMGLYDDC